MAFNFPNTPTVGQTFAPSGGPTYVYDGSVWKVLTPGSSFNRTTFTATSGQTTFSLTYSVNFIDVFRNGVKLNTADFTATDGATVVLGSGCTAGDTVEIISYPQVVYVNALAKTGDTMTGDLTVPNLYTTGNVGVGTSTPGTKLDVSGNINVGASGNKNYQIATDSNGLFLLDRTNTRYPFKINAGAYDNGFVMDSSGRITMPYQPLFFAYGNGSQSWSGTAAYQVLQLNQTLTYGSHPNNFNTSTYTFTAPVAGTYLFFVKITQATAVGGPSVILFVNGAAVGVEAVIAYNLAYMSSSGLIPLQLAANDAVTVRVINYNNVSVNLDTTRCNFAGWLMG